MKAAADRAGFRVLLDLAWPMVLARSAQAVIGFCDALMIAPLGEAQLAAVTTGAINVFALTVFPMGVVFIVQSFAAQLKSKRAYRAARHYAWYGLIVSAVAGVLAVASSPIVGPVLGWLAFEPAVAQAMAGYLVIRVWGVGARVATETLGNWYGGLGNTRVHMVAGLLAMVVNVALNWVLIYGNLGAPALGVDGAALASVIATWLGLGTLALPFARRWWIGGELERGPALRRGPAYRPGLGLRSSELWRMLRFGLPNGANWFLEFAAFALFINVIITDLGTTVLAANMVVFNINSVSFMPAFGLSSAGAILTGQAIGAGHKHQVAGIVKRTMMVAACWQGSVGLVYLVLPRQLMSWFATPGGNTDKLLSVGAVMLAISAAWQLFDAAAMTLSEALRSAGDTAWCMWARVVVAWLVFVPAGVVSVMWLGGGYVAAMICIVGYLGILAAVFAWRFRSGAWRRIDLTGSEAELLAGG